MNLYLIEVCDYDNECRTIRKGVRASLKNAETLVSELISEYMNHDYTINAETHNITPSAFISCKAMKWDMWSQNGRHDLYIRLSDGRMDTQEYRLWIDNEDDGKMFASYDEMIEYLMDNYELWKHAADDLDAELKHK